MFESKLPFELLPSLPLKSRDKPERLGFAAAPWEISILEFSRRELFRERAPRESAEKLDCLQDTGLATPIWADQEGDGL